MSTTSTSSKSQEYQRVYSFHHFLRNPSVDSIPYWLSEIETNWDTFSNTFKSYLSRTVSLSRATNQNFTIHDFPAKFSEEFFRDIIEAYEYRLEFPVGLHSSVFNRLSEEDLKMANNGRSEILSTANRGLILRNLALQMIPPGVSQYSASSLDLVRALDGGSSFTSSMTEVTGTVSPGRRTTFEYSELASTAYVLVATYESLGVKSLPKFVSKNGKLLHVGVVASSGVHQILGAFDSRQGAEVGLARAFEFNKKYNQELGYQGVSGSRKRFSYFKAGPGAPNMYPNWLDTGYKFSSFYIEEVPVITSKDTLINFINYGVPLKEAS